MLSICRELFSHLNTSRIRYCHWKSNTHLSDALEGKTDLDLLVDGETKARFQDILKQLHIIKILSPPEKSFPGMEDYLGLDEVTGELIHLHVHYKLIMGQRYIKNHHLPIEHVIFHHLTKEGDVPTPIPELELLLLIIRAHMKLNFLSLIRHAVKDLMGAEGYTAFPRDIEEELHCLIRDAHLPELQKILQKARLPLPFSLYTNFIDRFRGKRLRCYHLIKTQWVIFRRLKNFRRLPSFYQQIFYLGRVARHSPWVRKLLVDKKKKLPGKGRIISLVGADGSGKSTLVQDLQKWLSWKLATRTFYYGIPKTRFLHLLSLGIRFFNKFRLLRSAELMQSFLWSLIAVRRYHICRLSRKQAGEGNIVVTDRFPLKQFHQMEEPMDGPRLGNPKTPLEQLFSRMERKAYDHLEAPDLVIVLQADIETLRSRKDDLALDKHTLKAAAVNRIKNGGEIFVMDATQPYATVLLQVKNKIWECLAGPLPHDFECKETEQC